MILVRKKKLNLFFLEQINFWWIGWIMKELELWKNHPVEWRFSAFLKIKHEIVVGEWNRSWRTATVSKRSEKNAFRWSIHLVQRMQKISRPSFWRNAEKCEGGSVKNFWGWSSLLLFSINIKGIKRQYKGKYTEFEETLNRHNKIREHSRIWIGVKMSLGLDYHSLFIKSFIYLNLFFGFVTK